MDTVKRPKADQLPSLGHDPHDLFGWTLERKQKLVDSLETVLHEGMQAVKHARITHQGKVTEEYEYVDYMARLRSAELVSRVTGLRAGSKEAQSVAQITIKPPAWACQKSPETIPSEAKPADDVRHD